MIKLNWFLDPSEIDLRRSRVTDETYGTGTRTVSQAQRAADRVNAYTGRQTVDPNAAAQRSIDQDSAVAAMIAAQEARAPSNPPPPPVRDNSYDREVDERAANFETSGAGREQSTGVPVPIRGDEHRPKIGLSQAEINTMAQFTFEGNMNEFKRMYPGKSDSEIVAMIARDITENGLPRN